MPVTLRLEAAEGSTYKITASLSDSSGAPVVPDSFMWTLRNRHRKIVNGRENVVSVPDTSIDIILSGADLPSGRLTLIVDAVYSSTDGAGLPLRDSVSFLVKDIMD